MNSDTRQPRAQQSGKVPSGRLRRIVISLFLGCCVFGGFATYAFVSPATYEAHAEVRLVVSEDKPALLYPIADRRQRLQDALLRKDSLKRLAEKLGATTPDARLELASRVERATSIETTDGRNYRIACRASSAKDSQAFCRAVSELVVSSLPQAAMRQGLEPAQTERMEQLLLFLSSHPQLSTATNPNAAESDRARRAPSEDPLIKALNAQRLVVQKELAELQKIDPANPYVGTLSQEITQAKRQLGAIDNAIIKRQHGLRQSPESDANAPSSPEPTAIDGAAWKQLSALLAELGTASKQAPPADQVRATVRVPPALPESPISPNRVRLMILGALGGLGVSIIGLGIALAARTRQPSVSAPDEALRAFAVPRIGDFEAEPFHLRAGSAPPPPQLGMNDLPQGAQPGGLTVTQSLQDYHNATGRNATYVVGQVGGGVDRRPIVSPTPTPFEAEEGALAPAIIHSLVHEAGNPKFEDDAKFDDAKFDDAKFDGAKFDDAKFDDAKVERVVSEKSPRTQLGGFHLAEPDQTHSQEVDVVPRTQLGGFEPKAPPRETPSRPTGPISARGLITVEARVDSSDEAAADDPPEDNSPQANVHASASPGRAYVAPKRNITRRLGSLSWLDNSELPSAPRQSPASTRYSYVSSRPPPPEERTADAHASEWTTLPAQGRFPQVTDTYAEPQEHALATVPRAVNSLPTATQHPAPVGWKMPQLEPLATAHLVEQVLAGAGNECCVVGITSNPEWSKAKAQLAASLAVSLGEVGQRRVALIEGNFQEPLVHKLLQIEMPMASGFSQQLQRRLVRSAANSLPWELVQCLGTLDVMAEGFIRSPGAILSQYFEQCLNALKLIYDVIILDGPPLGTSSECRAFTEVVDGVVICTSPNGQQIHSLAASLFQEKRFVLVQPASPK